VADIIDSELADLRGRTRAEYVEAERRDACSMGDNDPIVAPRLIDVRVRVPAGHRARQVIESTLAAAWSLSVTTRPPPGSARVRTASPGKARLVRSDGDGWTLIGRSDGPALLLADAIPGAIIDIGDEPRLNELLAALTAAAERARL
jgi:hypothetical protein